MEKAHREEPPVQVLESFGLGHIKATRPTLDLLARFAREPDLRQSEDR